MGQIKNLGRLLPVHVLRRFFNYFGAKCVGIEVRHRGPLHEVTAMFDTEADAAGFYRAMQQIWQGPTP